MTETRAHLFTQPSCHPVTAITDVWVCCTALPDTLWSISRLILHGFCSSWAYFKAPTKPRNLTWSSEAILAWSLYREALNGASPRYTLIVALGSGFMPTHAATQYSTQKSAIFRPLPSLWVYSIRLCRQQICPLNERTRGSHFVGMQAGGRAAI